MIDNEIETIADLLEDHEWISYGENGWYEDQCSCGWRPTKEEVSQFRGVDYAHQHHVAVQLAHSHLSSLRIAWIEGFSSGSIVSDPADLDITVEEIWDHCVNPYGDGDENLVEEQ